MRKKKKDTGFTHKELVKKAVYWLGHAKKCNPVFGERGSRQISEVPDAIGFTAHESIVVEVKVSKSDLLADKKKKHRTDGKGMGNRRFYLMPQDLYEQLEDHDWEGWGVLTCNRYGTKQARGMASGEFESCIKSERDFLRSRVLEIQNFGR